MLSEDRQSHWVHLIIDGLEKKNLVHWTDKSQAVRAGLRAMSRFMKEHKRIETRVLNKIAGLKRNVSEHSAEWAVLYNNYYEDELSRSHLRQ